MRTYGRLTNPDGSFKQDADGAFIWAEVDTVNGDDSAVWLTTLSNNLLLWWDESPSFGQTGIPYGDAFQSQTPPDYYIALIQQRYQQYFKTLSIVQAPQRKKLDDGSTSVSYHVAVTFKNGTSAVYPVTPVAG